MDLRVGELDYKESWVPKNWSFSTVVLQKTLESPLDCKEIKPVHPKVNQSWMSTGRTDAEAEAPILWPPDAKNWLLRKDPDAGEDWGQEEKVTTEDKMVGWHHWLNGHEFERALGDSEGRGGLACCSHETVETEQQQLILHAATWINLANIRLSERRQSRTQIRSHLYDISSIGK